MCFIYAKFNSNGHSNIHSAWHKHGLPNKVKNSPFKVQGFSRCPVCGVVRPYHEMIPSDHCEKPLCNKCYDDLFVNNNSEQCVVCGEWLSKEKNEQIRMNPRELESHCCDWECFAFLIDRFTRALTPDLIPRYPGDFDEIKNIGSSLNNSGIIDAEYEDIISPRALGPGQRAIAPGSTQTFDEWKQQNNVSTPEDNVVYAPFPNKKQWG